MFAHQHLPALSILAAASLPPLHAQSGPNIPDPSFELGTFVKDGTFAGGDSSDAQTHYQNFIVPGNGSQEVDPGNLLIQSSQAYDGARYLWLASTYCVNIMPSVSGSIVYQAGQRYQICGYFASGSERETSAASFELDNFDRLITDLTFSTGGFLDLNSGYVIFGQDPNSGWSDAALDADGIPWTYACIEFTATVDISGTPDSIFRISNQGGAPLLVDNLSIQAIPEPSTAILLGLSSLALTRRRRN